METGTKSLFLPSERLRIDMQRSGDLVFPNLPAIRSKRFSLELRRNKIVMAKIIDWTRTIAFEKCKSNRILALPTSNRSNQAVLEST